MVTISLISGAIITRRAITSGYCWRAAFRLRGGHWMAALRHSSDAYLHMPSCGENLLLMGVTF
jgi:hypothetical protein